METHSTFYEISALLLFASAVAGVGLAFRQPLIVSFIAAGVLAGPAALGLAQSLGHLELLAELGVSLLLFVVGLKLDPHLIRTTGPVALTTGLGQVAFTSIIGYAICLALGLSPLASAYVAVALTFSSTIIIVKLLSDKGEIDSLHGRVALGFLIVQDVVVVIVMIVLSAIGVGTQSEDGPALTLFFVLVKGALLLGGVAILMRMATRILDRIAASPELLLLSTVGLAVALASISDGLGFSKEMGAFLAGVALAATPYREVIGARLMGLRDFMLLFFFLALGARMDLSTLTGQIVPAILLSLFVLIGNPLIVMVIMGVMGYRKRTGLLAGLTVAQISEFSLIFAALGAGLGHIDEETVGLVTLVGLVTIGLSTYMILYSHKLYALLEPWLGMFERGVPHREQIGEAALPNAGYDIVLFGLGRFGTNIGRGLRQGGLSVLGVDFDPEMVRQWEAQGHPAVYGDANDPAFIESLPLHHCKWVVSAIPPHPAGLTHTDPTLVLLRALRAAGYEGKVAVTAQRALDVPALKERGADLVLLPFADAARHAVEAVTRHLDHPRHAESPAISVMAGLDPAIHVDPRVKPGGDDNEG